ncbi:MAG TPA: ACP S-malonyltransferase [bacterium]|nr:ACP S-malonyltransferase [bacterium]
MARIAAIFPNEGSHYVGMGKDFYAKSMSVREYFDKAEKLLGLKLAKTCFLGPKEEQDKLSNSQVITFVNDVAFFDPLVKSRRKPELLTGIGVGEVAALVCAECLPYPNALQFVVGRAKLIEAFAQKHGGAALSLTGVTLEKLQPLLTREEGELIITHYLAPDTFIIYGPTEAIQSLQTELQGIKDLRTNPQLPRGPLFSAKAAELEPALNTLLNECLAGLQIKHPKITLLRSSDGEYIGTIEMVRDVLIKQYSTPVDWIKTVTAANLRGFRVWVEVGPGKVYGTMVRKIDKNNMVTNVENSQTLTAAVKATG